MFRESEQTFYSLCVSFLPSLLDLPMSRRWTTLRPHSHHQQRHIVLLRCGIREWTTVQAVLTGTAFRKTFEKPSADTVRANDLQALVHLSAGHRGKPAADQMRL